MALTLLFLADVVGQTGVSVVQERLEALKQAFCADITIVNGENAAEGIGIEPAQADQLRAAGADIISSGNHVWAKPEILSYLDQHQKSIIRPLNNSPSGAGAGLASFHTRSGTTVNIINLQGRQLMEEPLECPFAAVDACLTQESGISDGITVVDFHAEATCEKAAMGYYLDGRVSAVIGTHTHVQTADECILPKGTAFISDAGMCGPADGMIGVDKQHILDVYVDSCSSPFRLAAGQLRMLNGVVVTIDPESGRALSIERIFERFSK